MTGGEIKCMNLGETRYYTIGKEEQHNLVISIYTKNPPRAKEFYGITALFYKSSMYCSSDYAYIFVEKDDNTVTFSEELEIKKRPKRTYKVGVYMTTEEFQTFLEQCCNYVRKFTSEYQRKLREEERLSKLYDIVQFGFIKNHDEFKKIIEQFTDEELANVFRHRTSDYVDTVATLMKLRPRIFEIYENEKVWLSARTKVKGLEYLLEHQHECPVERLVELIYIYSEPKDLPLIKSLPEEIRVKLVKLIQYHEDFDDPYRWIWKVKDEIIECDSPDPQRPVWSFPK